jgi:pimeloyl-ACP methyl ester carboxylesterase
MCALNHLECTTPWTALKERLGFPSSPVSLGADLVALWDALEIKRSNLVALGLGGPVAMRVAIDHPSRIIALMPTCCRPGMVPDFAARWHSLTETVANPSSSKIAPVQTAPSVPKK